MRIQRSIKSFILNIITACISLVFVIPLLVVLINSFKNKAESSTMTLKLPTEWVWSNFSVVIERGKLFLSFYNSILYAVIGSLIIMILVSVAGFVLMRRRTRLNRFIYYFIILGIAMPINYVTLMKIMQFTHLINTRIGIILIYVAMNIPISLFIVSGFIKNLPVEIDEAAVIDGCNSFQLITKIIFPMLSPAMITIFILNFIGIWNDFVMPLYYLNSSQKWPMTLAVYNFFGMYERQWNMVSADIMLTILPVLIIFVVAQKYIVGGIGDGAVKG